MFTDVLSPQDNCSPTTSAKCFKVLKHPWQWNATIKPVISTSSKIFRKYFTLKQAEFKNVNHFSETKKAFLVKLKIFSV
jgi:hypothetical protein